jgi:L-iditol 2-dehydrogenase
LLLAALAKLRGAGVIVTGRGAERLALARQFGVDVVLDVSGKSFEEQREMVRQQTEGQRGADVVIEAIGTPETWSLAASISRRGGLVNFFGGCSAGTQVTLETHPLHYGELTMKGVFHHTPTYFAQALELISDRSIDVEAVITASVPLASTLEVFERLLRKQGIKYALIPPAFAHEQVLPADLA